MNLPRSLVKDFANLTNGGDEAKKNSVYARGTVKMVGDKKFVQLDGSDSLTPLTETVDVQDDDRVMVVIENHMATVLGNYTFPPSARKEQDALDKAENAQDSADHAQDTATDAQLKAEEAQKKADEAALDAGKASEAAGTAKQHAEDAMTAAGNASQSAEDAKLSAQDAVTAAGTATEEARKAQEAVKGATEEINRITGEVTNVKVGLTDALEELERQAGEIQGTKETLEHDYAQKTEVATVEANLKTEITKKVGELETTVSETYAAKNEVVEIEGKLQSQITQNKDGITSTVSKVEKLETDTEEAMDKVNQALSSAFDAQAAADQAREYANKAQTEAESAKTQAQLAADKATQAQKDADAARALVEAADQKLADAKTVLREAEENLKSLEEAGATEEEIAEAKAKVDSAQTAVNQALEDVAEAEYAANKAEEAAIQAEADSLKAQEAALKAEQKATNAEAVAQKAETAAREAQAKVAALTKRVEEAHTAIQQTNEQIKLTAEKTKELGDLLKNDYYTKTETQAAIDLKSNEITLEVSNKYTAKGDAVSAAIDEFYLSTSPTELSGGTWSTTQPTWTEGKYIWNRMVITYADGKTIYSPSEKGVCIIGNSGQNGVGVGEIVNFYKTTTNNTIPEVPSSAGRNYLHDSDYEFTITGTGTAANYASPNTHLIHPAIEAIQQMEGMRAVVSVRVKLENAVFESPNNRNRVGYELTVVKDNSSDFYLGGWEHFDPATPITAEVVGITRYTFEKYASIDESSGHLHIQGLKSGTVTVSRPKLEVGDVATDWSPAPEDLGWSETVPTLTPTNKYLWNYEMVVGTDGSVISYTDPRIIGVYGDSGQPGKDGVGISSITEYYQISMSNTTAPTTWLTTVPTLTPTNKYLWNYEKITYTNGTTKETAKRVIGVYGDKGQTGAPGAAGKGVSKTEVFYYLSTSNTAQTGGSWVTTPPVWVDGRFYWQKIKTTFTDNTTSESTPVCITGGKGQAGAPGTAGTSVSSITTEFYLSTSKTTQTGGSWVTTMPTWSKGKYLWTRSKIVYANPAKTAYTTPICDSSWEAANDVAEDLHNNYYNKVETEAKIKVEADRITSTVKTTVKTEIDNVQIGGRNLQRNTDFTNGLNHWYMTDSTLYTVNDLRYGDKYTVQFHQEGATETKAKYLYSGSNKIPFTAGEEATASAYFYTEDSSAIDGGSPPRIGVWFYDAAGAMVAHDDTLIPFVDGKWVRVTATESAPENTAYVALVITVYRNGTFNIAMPKLEKGNKATDWSPAPEDVADDIAETGDRLTELSEQTNKHFTESQSQIQQLSDSISTLVVDENGTSMMTQTSDGWVFNMGTIENRVDDALSKADKAEGEVGQLSDIVDKTNSLMSDIAKKTAYINMSTDQNGDPCIELGKSDSPFKLRITNTSVDFMDETTRIAYFDNKSLYIERAIVNNELQIGETTGFVWRRRGNGNMGLRWVGGK